MASIKYLAVIALLLLSSCEPTITGGKIVGKDMGIDNFYIQVESGREVGSIKVTKDAWNQAKIGMEWPFEVK